MRSFSLVTIYGCNIRVSLGVFWPGDVVFFRIIE